VNNTTVISPVTENAPLVQEIPLDRIVESKTNPRRVFDERKLRELAANVKDHGVLQPILVRPHPEGDDGLFELVVGARRYRASKLAERPSIPARIVNLTDSAALELQIIENLHRADVHELDEAFGYKALMEQNPDLYTVEVIGTKVGKSPAYVLGRLKLTELIPTVQKAFYEGKLTVAHALEIARLQIPDQERAFAECFPQHQNPSAVLKDRGAQATITVRDLRQWIQREIHLDLSTAPFDANEPNLLPSAGACSACPKRTGNNPILFPDIKKRDTCTDPACFRQKRGALVQLRVKELEGNGEKPVQVSETHLYYGFKPHPGVLYRDDYREAKQGECAATVAAVMAEGKTVGSTLYVCTDKQCKVHHPRVTISPEEREQRRKQAEAVRVQQEYRKRLLTETLRRVPAELSRHEFEFVALRYFEQLGHDSEHRIFKFFAWEETKPKANGGYVDYPKLASGKLEKMTTAEIGKFLIVCALASDLYCPTYVGGGMLTKDSNLAREAAHYKVNAERILRDLKEKPASKTGKNSLTSAKAKPHTKKQ
jgi:ParB family transcriptional regulator, chromosome partitioning protein